MHKLIVLVLATASSAALAQTPTTNPMPDGSRDMYVGLGLASSPRWEGARERKTAALPVVQVQWSNGLFISGMSAGMHLSDNPAVEYGPLVTVVARRNDDGTSGGLGGVTNSSHLGGLVPQNSTQTSHRIPDDANRLYNMQPVPTRVEVGGFANFYLGEQVRVANSLLAGGGRDRNGVRYVLDLQRVSSELVPHHSLSAGVGLTLANRAYTETYFGVTPAEAAGGVNPEYAPKGGLKDVHAHLRWNWTFSPSWMMTSVVSVARLQGDAAKSPLVERPTNLSVSAALAYRF
jgi:outer membrane scaffolding protein for murein synthesis (MipA/OmpV family)